MIQARKTKAKQRNETKVLRGKQSPISCKIWQDNMENKSMRSKTSLSQVTTLESVSTSEDTPDRTQLAHLKVFDPGTRALKQVSCTI